MQKWTVNMSQLVRHALGAPSGGDVGHCGIGVHIVVLDVSYNLVIVFDGFMQVLPAVPALVQR